MEEHLQNMEFTTVGKTFQLIVRDGRDLRNALSLDEALWAATSAPADIFKCDPQFIRCLDPNKTGRITSKALKEAITWILDKISDPREIRQDFDGKLPLKLLAPENARKLAESAAYILEKNGAPERDTISLQQIRDFFANVAKLPFNGDAVISLAGAQQCSENFKDTVADVVATTGGTPDADGTQGATEKNILDFLAAVRDYLDWKQQGTIPQKAEKTELMPLGENTPACAQLIREADPLVSHVFTLSRLMAFDQRTQAKAMGTEAKLAALDPTSQDDVKDYLKGLPLAQPNSELSIQMDGEAINPAYQTLWLKLREQVLTPLLGQDLKSLTPEGWNQVRQSVAPYEAYMAAKKGGIVEKLPLEKLIHYRETAQDITNTTTEAAQRDKVVADINAAAREVEKLLLLRTYIIRFANNFISFPELYDANSRALFEMGSLVIDGRWFNLAFKVDAVPAHQALAKHSLLCIIYVEVTPAQQPKFTVAIPVTYGSIGNLAVGKRGVFMDLDGQESDAKITHIIANPVCIREALLAPFLKMGKMVEGKIETWSSNSEKNALNDFGKAVANPASTVNAKAQQPKPPADKQGMLLGASVAIAALGSAFAFISNTLSAMSSTALAITVACAVFALVAPLSIMAMIKLRKQDLSAMLEGCGWAINLRMKLNAKLRGQFTRFGRYPKDAKGTPKSRGFLLLCLLIIIVIAATYSVNWLAENTEWGKQYAPKAPSVAPTQPGKPTPTKK